jgi:hypothetical protein
MDDDTVALAPTTFGEHMESLAVVPGMSQMTKGTPRPGSSRVRLGSGKPLLHSDFSALESPAEYVSSPILNAMPVEPVSFCPCLLPFQLIII